MAGLLQILSTYEVTAVADVRSFPRSYRNPQFNREVIELDLSRKEIRYVWLRKLGGRRRGLGAASKNTCWKNKSFRSYADYMETNEFRNGIEEVVELAGVENVAIMCAEAVYWRCHRSMIADFLKSKGVEVTHILNEADSKEHKYTRCARIVGGELTYHEPF
jgi:uncharacterized protein (DUF488 family)